MSKLEGNPYLGSAFCSSVFSGSPPNGASVDVVDLLIAADLTCAQSARLTATPTRLATVQREFSAQKGRPKLPANISPTTSARVRAPGGDLLLKRGLPGSKRYNRWINQRLLVGNLRRILVNEARDYNDSFTAPDGAENESAASDFGHRPSLRTEEVKNHPAVRYWNELKSDAVIFHFFRKRREEDFIQLLRAENSETELPQESDEDPLMLLTHRVRRYFRWIGRYLRSDNSQSFAYELLEAAERAFFDCGAAADISHNKIAPGATTEDKTEETAEPICLKPSFRARNFFLDYETGELLSLGDKFAVHEDWLPDLSPSLRSRVMGDIGGAVLFWDLPAICRRLLYSLAGSWGLQATSVMAATVPETIKSGVDNIFSDTADERHKVVIVWTGDWPAAVPPFSVSKNLRAIIRNGLPSMG